MANTSRSSPLLSGTSISPVIWSSSSLTAPPRILLLYWPASEIAYLTGCVPREQHQSNFSKRNWDQKVVLTPPLLLSPHEPVLRIIITLHQALHNPTSSLHRCHVKMVMKNNKHTRSALPNTLCQPMCNGVTVALSACD